MKSENNSKTKSKSKNHNKNIMKVININVSKKPNPQMIIKYGNSKKVSTKSSKINIFNPYEQNKVECPHCQCGPDMLAPGPAAP